MEIDIDEIPKQKPPSILISDNKSLQNIEIGTQKIEDVPTARYLSEISGGKKQFLIGLFSPLIFLLILSFFTFTFYETAGKNFWGLGSSIELFLFGFMILFIFYILAIIISFISKNIYLGLGLILSPFFTIIILESFFW